MSRSYKKHPACNDSSAGTTRWKKRVANKRVRNSKDVPNGKAYKKVYESWDIRDFVFLESWEETKTRYMSRVERGLIDPEKFTLEDCYRQWYKDYRAK